MTRDRGHCNRSRRPVGRSRVDRIYSAAEACSSGEQRATAARSSSISLTTAPIRSVHPAGCSWRNRRGDEGRKSIFCCVCGPEDLTLRNNAGWPDRGGRTLHVRREQCVAAVVVRFVQCLACSRAKIRVPLACAVSSPTMIRVTSCLAARLPCVDSGGCVSQTTTPTLSNACHDGVIFVSGHAEGKGQGQEGSPRWWLQPRRGQRSAH